MPSILEYTTKQPKMKPAATPRLPLILKDAQGWWLTDVRTILRFDAEDKYARLTLVDGSAKVVFHSLADLEERLACGTRIGEFLFMRTHRSCIAAMHHGLAIGEKRHLVMVGGQQVPLGRRAWLHIRSVLGTIRSIDPPLRAA